MEWIKDASDLYQGFVLDHAEQVGTAESVLQGLFNLMPARLGNDELKTEMVYSLMNVWTLLNDAIFLRKRREDAKTGEYQREVVAYRQQQRNQLFPTMQAPPSPITPVWWETSMLVLNSVSFTELVVEMWARKHKKRWTAIFAIEVLKAIIRLAVLAKAKGAVLALQTVPARDYLQPKSPEDEKIVELAQTGGEGKRRRTLIDVAREKGLATTEAGRWAAYWKSQYSEDLPEAERYMPSMPTQATVAGEILHILRPVIYVVMIMRYGRRRWKPWFISFLVDIFSRYLTRQSGHLNRYEVETSSRRTMLWLFYLVRSPFYENILSAMLHKVPVPSIISNRKLAKMAYNSLEGISKVYRDLYFYTAGSD